MKFNQTSVRMWMRCYIQNFVDECNEVNTTLMAEDCAEAFNVKELDGPLDDPNHWIWDIAHEESERHEKQKENSINLED